MFSGFVHEILDLPNERTSAEETDAFTNKLIDAWMCDKIRPMQPFFDTTDYQVHMEWAINDLHGGLFEWEPLQETLNLALATSAIHRNDCAELRTLLSQGVNLGQESLRFGILPLSEAAKIGSNEVTEILVANNYPVIYGGITELYHPFNALYIHMMRGNKEGVKIWGDHLRRTGQDISEYFHPMDTVGFSDTEMVLFIDEELGDDLGGCRFRRQLFAAAVYNKEVETMRGLFARGGVDINRMEGEKDVSPLDAVLKLRWPGRRKGITHEMENSNLVVEFLLKNGANPDGCVEPVGVYTPFVEAVATENIPAATRLFEYGATVDKDRIISLMMNETDADWTDLLRRLASPEPEEDINRSSTSNLRDGKITDYYSIMVNKGENATTSI